MSASGVPVALRDQQRDGEAVGLIKRLGEEGDAVGPLQPSERVGFVERGERARRVLRQQVAQLVAGPDSQIVVAGKSSLFSM
jgi:hypothetical protein